MTEEYEQVEEEPSVDDANVDSEYEEVEVYEEEEFDADDGVGVDAEIYDDKFDWWGEKFAW